MKEAPRTELAPSAPGWTEDDLNCRLLAESGLFDAEAYREQIGGAGHPDPVAHYVHTGWREGLEPNRTFPGTLLLPYFASAGFSGPPAVTWLMLRSAGWPMPETLGVAEGWAAAIRATGLLEPRSYVMRAGLAVAGLDAALHYAVLGDRLGIAPSSGFDPAYYAARNPDVVEAKLNCLLHYFHNGRAEGRRPLPIAEIRDGGSFDPVKEAVLLVVHETSRTGAPILGWNIGTRLAKTYNVIVVYLGDGELTPSFRTLSASLVGPFNGVDRTQADIDFALRGVLERWRPRFAIVNSAESRIVVESLATCMVPTVLLMHEFASYVRFAPFLGETFDWCTELVFPAPIVARAAEDVHPAVRARCVHIKPQGVVLLPETGAPPQPDQVSMLAGFARARDKDSQFLVLGAGTVFIRKGVDLFLAAAAAVLRGRPDKPVHFVWVGQGYRPAEDMDYSVYLHEQLTRSGLVDHVTFVDEVTDLESIYSAADVFLLTSRLDPMPNVSIDAAARGIPIVCFQNASGTAELLSADPVTAAGVVPYMDAEAAGQAILRLARDEAFRERFSTAIRRLAETIFDMDAYVASLDSLGLAASERMVQQVADARILNADRAFDQAMFLGPRPIVEGREKSVLRYLATAAARGMGEPPRPDLALRRPCPGFNPRIYAMERQGSIPRHGEPLADYVRRGRPPGPWQVEVVRPDDPSFAAGLLGNLRIAIHAHFFYPDLAADLMARLASNRVSCDVLITTDDTDKARALGKATAGYSGGRVDVRVFPNRGRDLGPLLTGLAANLSAYDVVGHVHGKRSLFTGSQTMGNNWREFLWQNLIGGLHPMMDGIVARFEQEPALGLVFPSDPHLFGWSGNKDHATTLARRFGYADPLPDAFDFPVGTMFWARPAALRPLLDLRLAWDDYPPEPVPIDGTILHALERLPPIASRLAGLSYAVTHVPGLSWAP